MNHIQYMGGKSHRAATTGAAPRKVVYSGVGKGVPIASLLNYPYIKNSKFHLKEGTPYV